MAGATAGIRSFSNDPAAPARRIRCSKYSSQSVAMTNTADRGEHSRTWRTALSASAPIQASSTISSGFARFAIASVSARLPAVITVVPPLSSTKRSSSASTTSTLRSATRICSGPPTCPTLGPRAAILYCMLKGVAPLSIGRAASALDQTGLASFCHRVKTRVGAQLLEDAANMPADRAIADAELLGDLKVVHAPGQQPEHVAFAPGQVDFQALLLGGPLLRLASLLEQPAHRGRLEEELSIRRLADAAD